MLLKNVVGDLTIHEMRLKKHKKQQDSGSKDNPIALKAKKGKAMVELSSSSNDEQDDVETSLLVKKIPTEQT